MSQSSPNPVWNTNTTEFTPTSKPLHKATPYPTQQPPNDYYSQSSYNPYSPTERPYNPSYNRPPQTKSPQNLTLNESAANAREFVPSFSSPRQANPYPSYNAYSNPPYYSNRNFNSNRNTYVPPPSSTTPAGPLNSNAREFVPGGLSSLAISPPASLTLNTNAREFVPGTFKAEPSENGAKSTNGKEEEPQTSVQDEAEEGEQEEEQVEEEVQEEEQQEGEEEQPGEEVVEGEEQPAEEEAAEGEEQPAEEEVAEGDEEVVEGEQEEVAEGEQEEVADGEEAADGEEVNEEEEVVEEAEGEVVEGEEGEVEEVVEGEEVAEEGVEGEEQVEEEGEVVEGEEQAEEEQQGETEQLEGEVETETEPVEGEEPVNEETTEEPTAQSEPRQDTTTESTQSVQTKDLSKSNDSTTKPGELKKSTDKGSESPTKPRITYDQDDTWKPDNPTGKKMYTKNFLLQFQPYFKDKPDMPTVKDIQPSSEEDSERGQKGGRAGQYSRGGRSERFGGNRMSNRPSDRNIKRTPAVVLQTSENAWQRPKTADEKERFTRKVQSILNKLTPEKFDYFFEKIQKEVKVDSPTDLERFNELIFEKAVSEQRYCSTYAKLCKKFSEKAPEFRKTLLNYCQKQFTQKQPLPEDPGESATPEAKMEYEEKMTKMRSANLGLIKFIGELYKLKMLHEKIILFCLSSLLEKNIEDYCTLMNSVGKMLDEKSPSEVSTSLEKADAKIKSSDMGSKIKFAFMDTLELRKRKWVPRREVTGPKTIQEVHADIQKQKEEQEKKQVELDKKQSLRTVPAGRNDRSNFTSSKGSISKTQTPPKTRQTVEDDGEWQTSNKRGKKPMQQQQISKPLSKEGVIKNSFDMLNDESTNKNNNKKPAPKPAPAPSPAPAGISIEEFESKAEALLGKFFDSREPEEIMEFMEKYTNYMENFVSKLIIFALERGEKARKPAKDLLLSLRKKTPKQNWNGVFNKVFDFLQELIIDSPLCPTMFGDFVGTAIGEKMIDEGYLTSKLILEAQKQTSSQIVGGSLKALLQKGVDQTKDFCKKHNIVFSTYLKAGQTEEKFLSLYGLTSLHNGYYCKSEISDQIEEGETDTVLISWIEKNCIAHLEQDPSFIRYIMGGILKQFRDLNTISNKTPSAEDYEKEKAYFEQYSQVLHKFAKSKPDLLNEAHSFAKEQGVSPGVLGRICEHLLSTEVVAEEEVKQWRKRVEPLDDALAAVDAIFV